MQSNTPLLLSGGFSAGLILGLIISASIVLSHYQKVVNHAHWADEVIKEAIEDNPTFFDTIGEGDNWNNYIEYCPYAFDL